jgi:hypothetical protein
MVYLYSIIKQKCDMQRTLHIDSAAVRSSSSSRCRDVKCEACNRDILRLTFITMTRQLEEKNNGMSATDRRAVVSTGQRDCAAVPRIDC